MLAARVLSGNASPHTACPQAVQKWAPAQAIEPQRQQCLVLALTGTHPSA
jgi:hypothetical protein